ncbi:hypothetical protein ACM66B_003966 [Microbotryomycetes sp. NB124-2]
MDKVANASELEPRKSSVNGGGSSITSTKQPLLSPSLARASSSSTSLEQIELQDKVDAVWGTNASVLDRSNRNPQLTSPSSPPNGHVKGKARAEHGTEQDGDIGFSMNNTDKDEIKDGRVRYDEHEHEHEHESETDYDGTGNTFPPNQGDQDEQEEKRIADHLAQWSRMEAQKRKNARKSQVMVMPVAPTPTNLARKSSALLRAGSKRMSRSVDLTSSSQKDNANASLIGRGNESKRTQRRQSALLRGNSVDSSQTPTGVELDDIKEDTSFVTEHDPVTTRTEPDPFASRPASAVRATSYDTVSSDATRSSSSRHNSLFIEDLVSSAPPLGHRPASLVTPPPAASDPFSDDARVTRQRQRGDTMSSQQSDATVKGDDQSSSVGPQQQQQERQPYGAVKMESPLSSPTTRDSYGQGGAQGDDEQANQQLEEDDPYDERAVGWLDFLLCNCFRSRDGTEDEVQVGRTNPNE